MCVGGGVKVCVKGGGVIGVCEGGEGYRCV